MRLTPKCIQDKTQILAYPGFPWGRDIDSDGGGNLLFCKTFAKFKCIEFGPTGSAHPQRPIQISSCDRPFSQIKHSLHFVKMA